MARIMVVEDESIVAADIQQTLVALGHQVPAIAANGLDAIANADRTRPDLVLMDVRLQGDMDGIQTAAAIHQRCGVPVIFLTAFADMDTISRAKQTEPFGYVLKPFNDRELLGAIEVALTRHASERDLRRSARELDATLKLLPDAVLVTDAQGIITYANAAASRLLGGAQPALAGVFIGAASALGERLLERVRRDKLPTSLSGEGANALEGTAAPMFEGDELRGAVFTFRDLREQERVAHRMAVTDRLAALGTLAGGISHEVNTPLATVMSNQAFALQQLALLRQELSKHAPAQGAAPDAGRLEMIQRALVEALEGADRVSRIVADLRAFADPTDPSRGPVDLTAVVESSVRMAWHELKTRARVVRDFQAAPLVDGSETQLRQVVTNLLLNAAHAIKPGHVDANEVRIVLSSEPDAWSRLEVSDTGEGIAPGALTRVFEPFFTARQAGEGATGLGLSVSHTIVASHGGELTASSTRGHGSTFTVRLPPRVA